MLSGEGIGERGRGDQAREGKTNNLARHLYSSKEGEALQSRQGAGFGKLVIAEPSRGDHVHADSCSNERGRVAK
jgi:hypothetical protein